MSLSFSRDNPVIFHRFQIQLNSLPDIRQGFLSGFPLADTAGQRWYVCRIATFIIGFQDNF